MGRKHRETITGATYHIFSRCISRLDLLKSSWIKDLFLQVISETQEKYEFELNTVIILDNHFHMVIRTTSSCDTISLIMQRIKSVFARRYNKIHSRTGPFWNERFGHKIVEKAKDIVKYTIHLLWYAAYNSVRKGTVTDPRNYKYSSINAYLDKTFKFPLKITRHKIFKNLGRTFKERTEKFLEYESIYKEYLSKKTLSDLKF